MEHPERNEDFGLTDPESRLAVICDGVGGRPGAERAARVAARTVREQWRKTQARFAERYARAGESARVHELDALLCQLLEDANTAVQVESVRLARHVQKMDKKSEQPEETSSKKGGSLGTTIALALFLPQRNGYLMGYAHIGDSRIYLLRLNEALQRLTADDGYFEWKIDRGEMAVQDGPRIEQATSAEQLSEEDRDHFDHRNRISQALGDESIRLHVGQIMIYRDDRVLLCTDGIHDNLTDVEIEETLRKGARTTVAKALLKRTVERSEQDLAVCLRAKKDDMSLIVITCH